MEISDQPDERDDPLESKDVDILKTIVRLFILEKRINSYF